MTEGFRIDALQSEGSSEGRRVPPTLVGGVGYAFLRDFSVGPILVRELQDESWPDPIVVEDLSYGPVAVVHRLNEADPPFRRLLVVGAVRRGGAPGAVRAYRWDGVLPAPDEIQDRVSEAVTGVIGLENLVLVPAALGAVPKEIVVVEVEPEVEASGEGLSPRVRSGAERAKKAIRRLVRTPEGEIRIATGPLVRGLPTQNERDDAPSPGSGHSPRLDGRRGP